MPGSAPAGGCPGGSVSLPGGPEIEQPAYQALRSAERAGERTMKTAILLEMQAEKSVFSGYPFKTTVLVRFAEGLGDVLWPEAHRAVVEAVQPAVRCGG